MKIADVTYTGRRRHVRRRFPNGNEYVFSSGTRTGTATLAVDSYEDATRFAEIDGYDVEWSALGQLVHEAGGTLSAAGDALAEMKYQQKQALASKLGLSGSGKEEDLDERLRPAVEELREEMEEGDL